MKNLTLIILCFFGLNIMAQKTVVIEAKDNKNTKDTEAIKALKKTAIKLIVGGDTIDAKITKIVTDPTQEDIRDLTPQLAKSVADLKKYHSHEVAIATLKTEKKQLEDKITSLKSGNESALSDVKDELENCKSQSKNAQENQRKIEEAKKYTKIMINKCLQFGSEEVPKEIRDYLINSAKNLKLTEEKESLMEYNSRVSKMKTAMDQLAKAYNKVEIEKKIIALKGSTNFPKLNTESKKIIKSLEYYCVINNKLLERLNKQNGITVTQMRKDNIKRSSEFKIIDRDGYDYLKEQAESCIDNKSHSLKKIDCP